MRILIAGGDGFLGSHMTRHLLEGGHHVAVLENKSAAKARRLGDVAARLEWIQGDSSDATTCREACRDRDVAFYFVSSTNPGETWTDPVREIQDNLLRSVIFLEAAAASGVLKVAFPSSGGTVYGRTTGRVTEDAATRPFSPHGIAKRSAEMFADQIRERTGLQIDVYRISNAYGPAQRSDRGQGVVAVWMRRILEGEPLHVYGDERTRRDYVYVGDVCELMSLSVQDPVTSGTYNVSSGELLSIFDLLHVFEEIVPEPFAFDVEPRRAFDNICTDLDNARIIERHPGFEFTPIREGLKTTWSWYARREGW